MTSRLDDLWRSAAHDGAFCPVGVRDLETGLEDTEPEAGLLLQAWYRERAERIESSLLVEEARRLIARLVLECDLTPVRRRQAQRLLLAIRDAQQGHGEPKSD